MTNTPVLTRPKPRRRRKIDAAMRQRIEAAIEAMIVALDVLDAPGEDLEPEDENDINYDGRGADDEPSLGATEQISQSWTWDIRNNSGLIDGEIGLGDPGGYNPTSQVYRAARFGADDDREMHEDDEPSLGSIDGFPDIGDRTYGDGVHRQSGLDQTRWAAGNNDDREEEHDGREHDVDDEPSLGSFDGVIDQRQSWLEHIPPGRFHQPGMDLELDPTEQEGTDDPEDPVHFGGLPYDGAAADAGAEAGRALREIARCRKAKPPQ